MGKSLVRQEKATVGISKKRTDHTKEFLPSIKPSSVETKKLKFKAWFPFLIPTSGISLAVFAASWASLLTRDGFHAPTPGMDGVFFIGSIIMTFTAGVCALMSLSNFLDFEKSSWDELSSREARNTNSKLGVVTTTIDTNDRYTKELMLKRLNYRSMFNPIFILKPRVFSHYLRFDSTNDTFIEEKIVAHGFRLKRVTSKYATESSLFEESLKQLEVLNR